MIFAWDEINRGHISKHRVSVEEAEQIVRNASPPFPRHVEDGKYLVWGRTSKGRYLQVIFVLKGPNDVAYESLTIADWMSVEEGEVDEIVRVIHAMDLTPAMKRQLRRSRR